MTQNGRIPFLFFATVVLMFVSCDLVTKSGSSGSIDWEDGSSMISAEDQHLNEEVRALYLEDAEKLAVRYINAKDSTQTEIPQELIALLYDGLIHIVNSGHPKAEEVTSEFNVHASKQADPREIIVYADTTASWISAWRNETTETGNPEMDALLEQFNFNLVEYFEPKNLLAEGLARLRSNRAINGHAVGRLFEEIPDINTARPNRIVGDGSDISVLFFEDRLLYTFEYGFGDCPAGCINRHFWKFTVSEQGNVDFVEEGGDPVAND